jgi:hypothetical protein
MKTNWTLARYQKKASTEQKEGGVIDIYSQLFLTISLLDWIYLTHKWIPEKLQI